MLNTTHQLAWQTEQLQVLTALGTKQTVDSSIQLQLLMIGVGARYYVVYFPKWPTAAVFPHVYTTIHTRHYMSYKLTHVSPISTLCTQPIHTRHYELQA